MKKKILFIVYTHSHGGGAEKILTNIVNGLNQDKYEIDILEYADYGIKREKLNPGIKTYSVLSMNNDNKYKRLWKNIQAYSYAGFLKRKKGKYDLEISFNYLIPTFLLSRKVPAISWFHGDINNLKHQPYYRMRQRQSLKHVKRIVAISENTRQSIVDVYPEYRDKIDVIYNGFNVETIREKAKEKTELEIKKPSIGYVGRLEAGKNPLVLLEVIKKLKEDGIKMYLYYMGMGEKEQELHEKIRSYNLEDQVKVLGYQQNPYPIMNQLSALCMMSHSEGFPTVFAEGMALGIPFVSTPVGGVGELSNQGQCGCVVNDIQECVDALKNNILEQVIYNKMCEDCKEHIQKFSLDAQIRKIEALVDGILWKNEE